MKTFSIIKLTNLSPIHIGMGREVTDNSAHTLHSDTLSAALAAIRVQTKGAERIKEFINSFSISSAFPFWEGQLFLPKPQGRLHVKVEEKEESEIRSSSSGIFIIVKQDYIFSPMQKKNYLRNYMTSSQFSVNKV